MRLGPDSTRSMCSEIPRRVSQKFVSEGTLWADVNALRNYPPKERTYLPCAEGGYACISRLVPINDATAPYARSWWCAACKKAITHSTKCGSTGMPCRLAKSTQKLLLGCFAVCAKRCEKSDARCRPENRCIRSVLAFEAASSTGPRTTPRKGMYRALRSGREDVVSTLMLGNS